MRNLYSLRGLSEEAVRVLVGTLNDFQQSGKERAERGRILSTSTRLGSIDAVQRQREGCYLRLVSIVEAYTDVLSSILFEPLALDGRKVVRSLVSEAQINVSRSWQDRIEGFDKHHQIDLTKCPVWSEVRGAIEVRNVIAHGLGSLTAKQLSTPGIRGKFLGVKVPVLEGRVVLTDENVERVTEWSIAYVGYLDSESQRDSADRPSQVGSAGRPGLRRAKRQGGPRPPDTDLPG